jgi:DNA (cytosine-5)-methyltransferase 1
MGHINLSDYMTIAEAAEYLGINPMTLRRWDNNGKLKTKRHPISNYRLYLKKDLEKILKGIK